MHGVPAQAGEREREPAVTPEPHVHEWESGRWGVIIGVSRCVRCGQVCRTQDFPARLTPEPISREDINRWKAIVAGRHGTGLTHEPVARLLAALEAGEALAQALVSLREQALLLQQRGRFYPKCEHSIYLRTETLEAILQALAGWRAIVEGKDDAPKANQS